MGQLVVLQGEIMRYLKVLLLAIFIFLALVFFFQNQGPLSQEMQLKLNLFFIPTMTSITLPFYFLVVSAFFVGCVLALLLLVWDKLHTSARLMKATWHNGSLQKQVVKMKQNNEALQKQLDEKKAIEAAAPVAAAQDKKTDLEKSANEKANPATASSVPQADEEKRITALAK